VGKAVKDLKVVAKKLLSPTANLVDRSAILKNLLHCTAVAHPIELGTPEKFTILADAPTATGSFSNKGVEMVFTFHALARAKADGPKVSAMHGDIKMTDTGGAEDMEGMKRSR
jgi:hypothetical protein